MFTVKLMSGVFVSFTLHTGFDVFLSVFIYLTEVCAVGWKLSVDSIGYIIDINEEHFFVFSGL